MLNVPRILADGRYRAVAMSGEVVGRCAWCRTSTPLLRVQAQGVLGNGTVVPVKEELLLCSHCNKPSFQPSVLARVTGGLGSFALSLFLAPLFGGSIYFTATFFMGWLRDDTFDAEFGTICLVSLVVTGVGLWLPLRRFIEAVRPGPVRVELPVEVLLERELNAGAQPGHRR